MSQKNRLTDILTLAKSSSLEAADQLLSILSDPQHFVTSPLLLQIARTSKNPAIQQRAYMNWMTQHDEEKSQNVNLESGNFWVTFAPQFTQARGTKRRFEPMSAEQPDNKATKTFKMI